LFEASAKVKLENRIETFIFVISVEEKRLNTNFLANKSTNLQKNVLKQVVGKKLNVFEILFELFSEFYRTWRNHNYRHFLINVGKKRNKVSSAEQRK